jgi:alpha-beta hydrolase superfamily lysophospholipase
MLEKLMSEDEAIVEKKMTLINRSRSIDDLAFTVAVTVASRTLILGNKFLRGVKRAPFEDPPCLKISRRSIVSDNQLLDAVFVAPAREPVRAAVLLCHGIGETVEHWFGVQKLLATEGVASLAFDYAGYGKSSGRVGWKQCEEDAIESFRALQALLPETPVSILGFSLGSGVAGAVLDRISPKTLILCSSFTSFQAAARYAGVPRGLSFLVPPIWNTEESLRHCSLPVLVLHGENDRLFPIQMAKNLASSCKEHGKLVIVKNLRHNDPYHRPHRQYWDHVVSILVSDHLSSR